MFLLGAYLILKREILVRIHTTNNGFPPVLGPNFLSERYLILL